MCIRDSLSTEHDAIAEYLLQEVDLHLQTDSRLRDMICSEHFSFNRMMDYVRNQYFTGYWNNYEIQITLCSQTDSVNVEPDLYRTPCFGFFDQMIHERGKDLPGTSFSFMDNNNGRVSYLGIFHYEKNNQQVALYVELDSKVTTDEVGYPALLLNKEHQTIADQDYSCLLYTSCSLYPRFLYIFSSILKNLLQFTTFLFQTLIL